jgi:hypothetical protein
MSDADHFLQDARKSFQLASEATGLKEIERYAAMGRDYLQLAHKAAKVMQVNDHDPQSIWSDPKLP